jgi:hypothetical protein
MGRVALEKFEFDVVRSQKARPLIIRIRPRLGSIKPNVRLRVGRSWEVHGSTSVKLRSSREELVPALSHFLLFLFISFEHDV